MGSRLLARTIFGLRTIFENALAHFPDQILKTKITERKTVAMNN